MRILGISGLAGAGKDTAADILVRDHGFAKVSLADPMKRAVADWFGWDSARLWGPSQNRNEPDPKYDGLSARKALQFLGTEIGRELYRDVWVEYALRTAKWLLDETADEDAEVGVRAYSSERGPGHAFGDNAPAGVVIPDVRFRNEVDAIHHAGGRVIRIVRASAGLTGAAAAHASEKEQAGIPDKLFDGVLYNDSTIENLAELVGAYVSLSRARAS